MRVVLQPAYVLHHRPYRETSVILDLLTAEYGRVSAIARGVRQARSPLKAVLQPFIPLLVSWQGKSELMTLLTAEAHGASPVLLGNGLLSGFYLNELITRLVPKFDAQHEIYHNYRQTLVALQQPAALQPALRLFEKKLLEALGYGLPLTHDLLQQDITAECYYRYHVEKGFEVVEVTPGEPTALFSGNSLLALAAETLVGAVVLQDIKRLMRVALAPLLGQQPLRSRLLYSSRIAEEPK